MSNILLAISGGIAAYKTPLIVRLLIKQGHHVRCVLTQASKTFVTPMTLQALTGQTVRSDLFDPASEAAMSHIELARWADLLLIAPATANVMAKLAHGIADDLLSTLYLATTADIVIAPAMNQQMWLHPATQENLATLTKRPKHHVLPVGDGAQACGDVGPGRLLEPEAIIEFVKTYLAQSTLCDLKERHIVITAGPTREKIDPVRYLSNHSSGKMGYALAQRAVNRGANVTLISGPSALTPPSGVTFVSVSSALEMLNAATMAAANCDIFIGAAAVSDYRIAEPSTHKQKKSVHGHLNLTLIENPDIIATIANYRDTCEHNPKGKRLYVVGFAAETEQLLTYAQDKLQRKNLDMIIANDVSRDVFGADDNAVHIITKDTTVSLPRQAKSTLADSILSHIHTQLTTRDA